MIEIDISLRSGLYKMASECSKLWFEGEMLHRRSPDVFQVLASRADLADESMRERLISLMANTPGLADIIQDTAVKVGVNLALVGISLTFRRDDTAKPGCANPWDHACLMRDLLAGESDFREAA